MARLRIARWTVLVLAALGWGFLPSAQASHDGGAPPPNRTAGPHEASPFPTLPLGDLCVGEFAGAWTYTSGGLHALSGPMSPLTPHPAGHNHYALDGEVVCEGDAAHTGTYVFRMGDSAFAGSGGTDGHGGNHAFDSHHGEVLTDGWSHCDGYSGGCPADASNANKGDVTVPLAVPTGNFSGSPGVSYVKFFRNNVTSLIMLGGIDWNSGPAVRNPFGTVDDCFFLEAQFVPAALNPLTGEFVAATVAGELRMYTPYMTGSSPCG